MRARSFISIEDISRHFGDVRAVDRVDLAIEQGEFFALLGPSGCGKTTLMRMLDGQDIAPVPPNRRATNMMFQSYALFPHLTVAENIAFGLKRDRLPRDRIAARVDEMLALVQLGPFAGRKPHQISGGQRQRVALARCLAKAPKLLLLDEPLGALDKKLREETQFELMDIQEKTGTTFVIVTHDQEEAMTVASRVAVMDHGRIVQVATPDAIYETPNSTYVADFIGDVNIFEGSARADGARVIIDWAEGQAPLVGMSEAAPTGRVFLAVRPEKVAISAERPADRANVVRGKVLDIGYLGNISTYHVEVPGGRVIRAQTANTDRIARREFTWEDEVWLIWSESAGVVLER